VVDLLREEPPGGAANVYGKWAAIIDTLVADPGEWYRIPGLYNGRQTGTHLKQGTYGGETGRRAMAEGRFETRTQNINGDESKIKIWARWIPNT